MPICEGDNLNLRILWALCTTRSRTHTKRRLFVSGARVGSAISRPGVEGVRGTATPKGVRSSNSGREFVEKQKNDDVLTVDS
jgi:hypothetical protein